MPRRVSGARNCSFGQTALGYFSVLRACTKQTDSMRFFIALALVSAAAAAGTAAAHGLQTVADKEFGISHFWRHSETGMKQWGKGDPMTPTTVHGYWWDFTHVNAT